MQRCLYKVTMSQLAHTTTTVVGNYVPQHVEAYAPNHDSAERAIAVPLQDMQPDGVRQRHLPGQSTIDEIGTLRSDTTLTSNSTVLGTQGEFLLSPEFKPCSFA